MKLNIIESNEGIVDTKDVVVLEMYDYSLMVISSLLREMELNLRSVRKPEELIVELRKQEPYILFYEWDHGTDDDRKLLKEIRKEFPNLKIVVIKHVAQELSIDNLKSEFSLDKMVIRPFSRREVNKVVSSMIK